MENQDEKYNEITEMSLCSTDNNAAHYSNISCQ